MSNSTSSNPHIDWNSFYSKCEEKRDLSDDVYRIAVLRAEHAFRQCDADGLSDEKVNYARLANIIHGIRIADSMEMAYYAIHESGIELTSFEEGALAILDTLDVTTGMKFIVP